MKDNSITIAEPCHGIENLSTALMMAAEPTEEKNIYVAVVIASICIQSNSDIQAAKSAATRPVELGRAGNGSWLRVPPIASGRTSEFLFA